MLTLFAIAGWIYTHHQLAEISRGKRSADGRTTIEIARAVCVFVTFIATTLFIVLAANVMGR